MTNWIELSSLVPFLAGFSLSAAVFTGYTAFVSARRAARLTKAAAAAAEMSSEAAAKAARLDDLMQRDALASEYSVGAARRNLLTVLLSELAEVQTTAQHLASNMDTAVDVPPDRRSVGVREDVPVERVRIGTETLSEEESISDAVRKGYADVDDPTTPK